MWKHLLAFVMLAFPLSAGAASVDLAISSGDISFSEELIAGESLRIYAQVSNVGDEDVSGYVSFFQGSVPISDSQVISVRSGGVPEEVYVDFVVPSGSFNIRAEIRGTDPQDENADNNVAITKLFTPIKDDDRDGVANDADNCPSNANESQRDTDGDGNGDACDADDDNDGLSDDVEEELGSDPTKRDTDGDGVADASDAYPTDASKSAVPAPVPAPAPAPAAVPAPIAAVEPEVEEEESTETVTSEAEEPAEVAVEIVQPQPAPEPTPEPSEPTLSPGSSFTFRRVSWNTYEFTTIAPEQSGERVAWDFGDGIVSSQRVVSHTYRRSGDFTVAFERVLPDGTRTEDATTVSVPFLTLQNGIVVAIVSLLGLLLLVGLAMIIRFSWMRRSSASSDAADAASDSDTEDPADQSAIDVDDTGGTDG